MSLFDQSIDYSQEVYRNIRGIKISQDLFDDLSSDPLNWEAANTIDIQTHPALTNSPLIQRAFDYSKNDFIDFPFEHITESRYSNGSIPCWYGSESLETTIFETRHHFIQEIRSSWESFRNQKEVKIDRRVAIVNCHGLAFDLTQKTEEFPWLVDAVNYIRCQEIGGRVAREGHPLLRVPSARHQEGVNLVTFNTSVLSNPREYCKLHYILNVSAREIRAFRGDIELLEPTFLVV
ncbi:RES family NAD+ phosphorylase [Legionella tunisiensis]|uniref:RES family NAD+ phosphorylase n=1 Tax=Legionella tunisiensis TaxID=1034944 RepID=UPI0003133338|nr:RES family NAD+ phosphorylase [Legionella tunisiensis]